MTIEILKLDNGEDFKVDTASNEYQMKLDIANNIGLRNDDSVFFARNLEYARQQVMTVAYPELKLLNGGLLPLDKSIPMGAETDSYRIEDFTGKAKIIADYADDIGTSELLGEEVINKIHTVGHSYIYSVQDLRRDRMVGGLGNSKLQRKANATRLAIDQKLEDMLSFGDDEFQVKGLFNAPLVPQANISGADWAAKAVANPLLILADIDKAKSDMHILTKGMEKPDTMLVDHIAYDILEKTFITLTAYEGMTLLAHIEKYKGLKVYSMSQMAGRFTAGASAFVLYKNDPMKVQGILSLIESHAPQVKNLATVNLFDARCGGTRVFRPYSVSVNKGV